MSSDDPESVLRSNPMKLYPTTQPTCECIADLHAETTVRVSPRGNPPIKKRAKQIHHYRVSDGARFWHWSDQTVEPTPMMELEEGSPRWVEDPPETARNGLD